MIPTTVGAPGALTAALPHHPRTGLQAIGVTRRGPIWPVMGGSQPTGEPAPAPADPPAPVDPTPQPTGQAPEAPQDVASLPPWAQKLITDARGEAAKHRTDKQSEAQKAQAAEAQRDAVLKALGLTADGKDAPPDSDALAAQIEQAQAVAWTTAVELAVVRTALAAGADAEKLLDSRAFIDSLDEFTADDPQAADFRTKLDAHIRAYVDKHPQYKQAAVAAAPRSGAPMAPGGAGGAPQRPRSIAEALARRRQT